MKIIKNMKTMRLEIGSTVQSVSFAREPNTLLIDREQHRLLRGICGANTKPSKIFNICKKVLLNALSLVDVFEHFD